MERDRLKNEQTQLERLSAGLMIDLQSTLLTSDDHVKAGTIISFLIFDLLKYFKHEIVIKFAEDPEFTNTDFLVPI